MVAAVQPCVQLLAVQRLLLKLKLSTEALKEVMVEENRHLRSHELGDDFPQAVGRLSPLEHGLLLQEQKSSLGRQCCSQLLVSSACCSESHDKL